jgi:hypothetical protein
MFILLIPYSFVKLKLRILKIFKKDYNALSSPSKMFNRKIFYKVFNHSVHRNPALQLVKHTKETLELLSYENGFVISIIIRPKNILQGTCCIQTLIFDFIRKELLWMM